MLNTQSGIYGMVKKLRPSELMDMINFSDGLVGWVA